MQERIIRHYVRFSVISGLGASFTFGSYTLFLQSLGLSLFEINLVNGIFMSARFLLEVPTGALADLYGRKRSVLWGTAISASGFLLYSRAGGFWSAVAAELTVALGGALVSGALGALVFDSLRHRGWGESFRPVARRRLQADLLARIAGASAASVLVGKDDLSFVWLVAAAGSLLAGLYLWRTIAEDYFEFREQKGLGRFVGGIREGMAEAVKNRSILLVVGFTAVFNLAIQGLNMYWPIVFRDDFGLDNHYINAAMAVISLMIYIGCRLSERVARSAKSERQALILPQLLTAVGIMLAASDLGFYPVMFGFLAHELSRGMFEPIREAYLQHRIGDSGKRATILSFQAMTGTLGMAAGLLGSGLIAESYSIGYSWFCSGLVMLVAVIVFLFMKNGEDTVLE